MDKLLKKINQYIGTSHHFRFVLFIATLVVFVTTYSLILPAITISKEAAEEEAGIVLENASEDMEEMTDEVVTETENAEEEPVIVEPEEIVEEVTTEVAETEPEETKQETVAELQPDEENEEENLVDLLQFEKEKDYVFTMESSFSKDAELELKEKEDEEYVAALEKVEEEYKDTEKQIYSARFFELEIKNNSTELSQKVKYTFTFNELIELKKNQVLVLACFDEDDKYHEWDEKKVEYKTEEEKIKEICFEADEISDNFMILVLEEPEEIKTELTDALYPAQSFEKSSNGLTVKAIAEEGTFPAGTIMKVTPVSENEVIDTIKGTVDTEINSVQAVDITFYDKDGNVIEPLKPIQVSMISEMISETDTQSIIHIDDEGNGTVIEQSETVESAEDEVVFDADSFSIYVVVGTIEKTILASDGHNYKITVSYGSDTGIPADAGLDVNEITEDSSIYNAYVSKTENALGMEEGSAEYIRLFDISIVKDGKKIQPAEGTNVDVKIELADSSSDRLNVIHFSDGTEEGEEVQSSTENGENGSVVEFQADGFSVYSIVDAPEPGNVSLSVNTIDEIEEDQDYFLSIARNGTNYMTSTRVSNGGTYELTGNTSTASAEMWRFEIPEEGKVNIYFLDSGGVKQYLNVDSSRNISFSTTPQPLLIEQTTNNTGSFYVYTVIGNKNWALSVRGSRNFFFEQRNNGVNANERVVLTKYVKDLYKLDGKTFGIAYNDNSTSAAALTAESGNGNTLKGLDLLIRNDVLDNDGNLLVAENSDIQEWTFEAIELDKYYIKTTVDGSEKYLHIQNGNVTLVDKNEASQIKATPGTDVNSGKWHFTVGNYSLNYGANSKSFNAANNSNATTWLNLVEKSTLSDDDFVEYTARKISVSDDILSATVKDDNGEILTDENGDPVYRTEKEQVVIYTRVWNETTKKYEFYAVDHDGSLIRVYDSGDQINWIGNKVNSALWEFTEYTNADGTPSYYYELENTAYTGTYLAPQSEGIISREPVGINLRGRRDGFDYSSIVAWDDSAYAFSGLKIVHNEDGSLKVVTCSLDEADDFNFAVIPTIEEADQTSTVETVDNKDFGISIKMIDFNNTIDRDNRDTKQRLYLGFKKWDQAHAYEAETGLVSTNLTNGYPTITANTAMNSQSLAGLFDNMAPANHLFIQSVYNESGYFEYDSTQNFAHLNGDGTFTVYNEIGAIGTNTGPTRSHGQFMPYNDISANTGYAHDTHGNIITNQYNVSGQELPDTDPRKGEPLYLIPQNQADYFFGMELSAVFTQTPDGVDNWGHDIIFEFTGDDDFWFYVDGELVLDLGGVHSALGGSVNFRTGEVICNGTATTLYEIFKSNYQTRGLDVSKVDELFVTKTVNGETVHVFNDYSTHEMKMFYMERGAGASNLKMRFNLASVQPGTVELSKKLKGIDQASNKLIQYPYQIWYQTANYTQNEDGTYVLDENGNRVVESYNTPVLLEQPSNNYNLNGKVYAVYKGTKTLIPYKDSMTIGGKQYDHVFLLKAGETSVINFPENTFRYKIVECGVDTAVYNHVYINGDQSDNEIYGKPYNNTDGWTETTVPETQPTSTTPYEGTTRSDFGISYNTTVERPRVEYTNEVPPEVMRTVSFKKVLYDTEGQPLTDDEAAQIKSTFNFRLYLGNEFADQENLLPADMYTYYVKGLDNKYCKWDKVNKTFVSLDVESYAEFKDLPEADQRAGTFTTSMYGSISKIPAGYTVEVRDLIVGTKYKIEEPDREIPKGYTRRDSDGYVRTDTDPDYVYYTEDSIYGKHPAEGNKKTAEPISDTIANKEESPKVEIRNQQGWGLTAQKEWTDKDFIIHDPIYLAVYLNDGTVNLGNEPIEGTVRRLNTYETEVYWFFPDLKINDDPKSFSQFVVREVKLEGTPVVDENTGVVTGYTSVKPVSDGEPITVGGRTYSGTPRTETYTVTYKPGDSTGQNENIRTDTITNSRPGIQIYKTDWDGAIYLAGAEFTLKDSEGHDVGHSSYISDKDGLVTTAYLNEGTFTLDEIKTPTGYAALDEPITITVTTTEPNQYDLSVVSGTTTYYIKLSGPNGFYTTTAATATDMARITVKNRTISGLKVKKIGVDGNTRTPLSGVHFALYDQVKDSEGNVRPAYNPKTGYDDLVTNEEGILESINTSLGTGTYYLREKAAPSGYKKLAEDLCFTIGKDGTVKINNTGYANWLSKDTSVPGTVSYQIAIENTPLGITIRKTDENGNALPGAKFKLYKKNDEGFNPVTEYSLTNGVIDLTNSADKTFTGMTNGIYWLTETDAPGGYVILTKEIYFKVSDGTLTLTDNRGEEKTYSDVVLKDDNTTIEVKNLPGSPLPSTGGSGTKMFTVMGILLVMVAGFLLCRRNITVHNR